MYIIIHESFYMFEQEIIEYDCSSKNGSKDFGQFVFIFVFQVQKKAV